MSQQARKVPLFLSCTVYDASQVGLFYVRDACLSERW